MGNRRVRKTMAEKFTAEDAGSIAELAKQVQIPADILMETLNNSIPGLADAQATWDYIQKRSEIDVEIAQLSEKLADAQRRRDALREPGEKKTRPEHCSFFRCMSDEDLIAWVTTEFRSVIPAKRALMNELIRKFLFYRAESGMYVRFLQEYGTKEVYGKEIEQYIADAPEQVRDALNGVPKDWF